MTRGGEAMVYRDPTDPRFVLKLNKADYYATWLEFLDSITLHNLFFHDTGYTLEGFTQVDGELHAILRQPFIIARGQAELNDIREYLENNGFIKTKRNDYSHPAFGLILEDMHDENVLVENDLLLFIDTVFYVVEPG